MAELLKVREITVDTMQYKDFATKEEELKVMRFYQNDLNSAKLLINVTHDKVVTDFSTATKVQIAFLKPDGKRVFQDVQNVNQMQGKYYVVLSTQTLIAYGNVVAQLRLTFPNNKVIETCKFVFAVDESIMSDTALESTNEFPVIQKAIEAGKKLEGVDIDGIIAAGAKADAALPKTGGTMTGDLIISGANKGMQLKNGTNTMHQAIDGNGDYYMYSSNSKTPIKYLTATDTFNVQATNTNLLKKVDVYTDYLQSSGNTKVLAAATDLNTVQATGCYAGSALVNSPEGLTSYLYIEVLRYSDVKYVKQVATILTGGAVPRVFVRRMNNNVWEAWVESISSSGGTINGDIALEPGKAINFKSNGSTNNVYVLRGQSGQNKLVLSDSTTGKFLLDYFSDTDVFSILSALALPKGATVTGPLLVSGVMSQLRIDDKAPSLRVDMPTDTSTTSARGIQYYENNVTMAGIGRIRNGTSVDQMYMGWGANPWSENTSLTVSDTKFLYKNKPVAMRDKDGMVNLTLTSEATNANAGYLPIADRRGNTVTVRMEVTRNAGSASPLICTLPADVRPANTVSMNFLANDGSVVGVNITWDGKVEMYVTGKQTKIVVTYAVN
ncbi:BppU family phage baseplate upper protein [Bacillus thuringiensis]|uniref:BppU family phage baseplate upper protein n=1 Tax=Bacillus thuringiensis TaxID=1428 RepID=UPI0021B190AF|nr:BppU family phage baseplate upper protein [Bacillus thuringiensis]